MKLDCYRRIADLTCRQCGFSKGIKLFAVMLVVVAGCGPSEEPTYPVTGKVTFADGNPVEGAAVSFVPDSGTKPAVGVTDAEGQYSLTTTSKGDGARAGSYKVTIAKYEGAPEESVGEGATLADPMDITNEYPEDYDEMRAGQNVAASKNTLPTRYADPNTSQLTATVVEGENTFDFTVEAR